jgi:hypothetical protein
MGGWGKKERQAHKLQDVTAWNDTFGSEVKAHSTRRATRRYRVLQVNNHNLYANGSLPVLAPCSESRAQEERSLDAFSV